MLSHRPSIASAGGAPAVNPFLARRNSVPAKDATIDDTFLPDWAMPLFAQSLPAAEEFDGYTFQSQNSSMSSRGASSNRTVSSSDDEQQTWCQEADGAERQERGIKRPAGFPQAQSFKLMKHRMIEDKYQQAQRGLLDIEQLPQPPPAPPAPSPPPTFGGQVSIAPAMNVPVTMSEQGIVSNKEQVTLGLVTNGTLAPLDKDSEDEEAEENDYEKNLEGGKKQKCWRKYGQKVLKGKDYVGMHMVRCYYRCNVAGCKVKRQVEKMVGQTDVEAKIIITGEHNHPVDETEVPVRITEMPMSSVPYINKSLASKRTTSPAFVITDPYRDEHPIIFASSGFCELTGYSLQEVIGLNCRFLQGPDTNKQAIQQMSVAIMKEEEVRLLLLNYKKDGTPFWNLVHITPIKDGNGRVASFIGSMADTSILAT